MRTDSAGWASIVDELLAKIDELPVPHTPVPWFLDIDGVLNLGRATASDWPAYTTGRVARDHLWFEFRWADGLIAVINRLVERGLVAVRWLTTWEHDGPAQVAPELKLVVGSWVAGEDRGREKSWWKLRVIEEYLVDEGGFFIWTDDDIFSCAAQAVTAFPLAQALIICPSPRTGLTPAHLFRILRTLDRG